MLTPDELLGPRGVVEEAGVGHAGGLSADHPRRRRDLRVEGRGDLTEVVVAHVAARVPDQIPACGRAVPVALPVPLEQLRRGAGLEEREHRARVEAQSMGQLGGGRGT
jgi:hypothetical protein